MALKLQTKDLYDIIAGRHPDWPGGLDANRAHFAYNGLDSAVTLRVLHKMKETMASQNTPHAATSYRFVRAMQGPAMDMMLRGIMVQQKVRQDETARCLRKRAQAQALLDRMADAIWGPEHYIETVRTKEMQTPLGKRGLPLSPRLVTITKQFLRTRPRGLNSASNLQMLAFFNGALNLPEEYEIRKTPQGHIKTPTAGDSALRKWAKFKMRGPGISPRDRSIQPVTFAQPFVSLILTLRDLDKQLAVLRTPLDPDGRMRCSYNVAGTENARWCLSGDHEVLTRKGWIRLDKWKGGEIVQWHHDQTLRWEIAVRREFSNNAPLLSINSRRISLNATAEHQQPYYTGKGMLLIGSLGEKKTLHSVPVGGQLQSNKFEPENKTRACVMMQADGSNITRNLVRFHFSKERKIDRCIQLLTNLMVPYKVAPSQDKTVYISVYNPPIWLQQAKFFGPWLLNHDPAIFCDEVKYWDGTWTGTATEYSTKEKENAEWVKTLGHLNNQFTSVFEKDRSSEGWSNSFRCCLTVDTTSRISQEMYTEGPTPEKVYCPETVTGFFLVRHNDQIIVTGNSSSKNAFGRGSNLQNVSDTMRRMFVADDGYILVSTDLEQAESRLVAGLVWQVTGDRAYLDACLSGDLHTQVCMMAWPELGWISTDPNDKTNRAIAEQKYPNLGGLTYRDVAKRIGHGSNYRGSAFGISQAVGIPSWIVQEFQARYFAAFPAIREWHLWVQTELRTLQYLDTPLYRRRIFFGRPHEDKTLREAIAFAPQSTVGELLNFIMYRVWRSTLLPHDDPSYLPIQLLLQNHDAFLFQVKESENLPSIIERVNAEFNRATIPFVRPTGEVLDLLIPGEFVTGWNWAKEDLDGKEFEDKNPDGLRKWRGAESRQRKQRAIVSASEWLGPSGPIFY